MIIAQITDTHIVPKGQSYKNMPETDTANRLKLVVERINELNPLPDVVLFTGDAIDKGGRDAYRHLKDLLKPLLMPVYIIPGNHDDRENMRDAFSDKSYMPKDGNIHYVIDEYPVRLIALDTNVPGQEYGLLSQDQLSWLEEKLKENTTKPTLIFMHHFPMKVGQKRIDEMECQVEGDFEKLIESSPNVIRIVAGHYHRTSAALYGGKLFYIAPSVASGHHFNTAEDMFVTAIDLTNPYFTLHDWRGGLRMFTESVQVVTQKHRIQLSL